MKKYSYYTESEQVNPLAQFDSGGSGDSPAGFSISTNCNWWQLIVQAKMYNVIDDDYFGGVYIEGCYYPMRVFANNTAEGYNIVGFDLFVDCGLKATPEFFVQKPVVIGFTAPGDFSVYKNPLFRPISTSDQNFFLLEEISIIMRRGYFEEIK